MKISPAAKDLLKTLLNFAKKRKARLYIVGGYLRDLLLGRPIDGSLDIDFCLKKSAINFGRKFAQEIRAGFVVLDEEHGACRIVKKTKDILYTLDFTDFRGPSLKGDLTKRDFTINAIALELESFFAVGDWHNFLIDPSAGRDDLKVKIIRVVNTKSFKEDPLRILRAFSFSSILGFKIDKATLRLASLERKRISDVSGERIRDELFKILNAGEAFKYLSQLDELKILTIIFPEIEKMRGIGQGPYHHLDVWQHTLETIRQLELLIGELKANKDIQNYLNEEISSERKRFALIKLGAFLHDVGKPKAMRREKRKIIFHGHERFGLDITEDIVRRLKLSNDELSSLKKIVLCHLRPGYLADNDELTARAKFRYFRDAAKEAVAVLLLSVADQRATKGPLTTKESRLRQESLAFSLIKDYFKKSKEQKIPRLINGNDLMSKFGLEPSPLIGKILSELDELQAIGRIKSKKEAFCAAKRLIK